MSLKEKFLKNKKPEESAPIISRTGKIARKNLDVHVEKQRKDGCSGSTKLVVERGVTISDNAFAEENAIRKHKKKGKRLVHTVKQKEKTPFPVMTVVFCVICTALFMSMVVYLVQINEYSKDVAQLRSQVETLGKEKNELQMQVNEKDNSEILRNYINEHSEEMGMVDGSMLNPPVAITPGKDDAVNDYEAEERDENIVVVVLNALADNLLNAWNIFSGNE